MKLEILKNIAKHPLGASTLGAGLGLGSAQLENKFLYDDPKTQEISNIVGTGTGGLAGYLLSKNKSSLAIPLIASFLGLKQMGLLATDAGKGYFDAVKEREKNETKIRNLILDTQKSTEQTAKNLQETTKYLADTLKSAFPYLGGLGLTGLGLYAYNSLKKNKDKQTINLKVDNKLPERASKSMYIEIPSSKISDKFYNQFGREILFKGDEEQLKEAIKKQEEGVNLTKKEKNILKENNILKAATTQPKHDSDVVLPDMVSLDKILYRKGPGAVLEALEKRNPKATRSQNLKILENVQDRNTPLITKIITQVKPLLKTIGLHLPEELS